MRAGCGVLAVLLVVLGLGAGPAGAADESCTTVWNGSDGDWATAANWSDGVPDANDVACVDSGTVTVSSGMRAAKQVVVWGTLAVAGGRLTLGGTTEAEQSFAQTLRVSGGELVPGAAGVGGFGLQVTAGVVRVGRLVYPGLSLSGGVVRGTGLLNLSNLDWSGGTFEPQGGPLTIGGGSATVHGAGARVVPAGASLVTSNLLVDATELRIEAGATTEGQLIFLRGAAAIRGAGTWSGEAGPTLGKDGAGTASYELASPIGSAQASEGELRIPAPTGDTLEHGVWATGGTVRFAGEPSLRVMRGMLVIDGAGSRVLTASGANAVAGLQRIEGQLRLHDATLAVSGGLDVVATGTFYDAIHLQGGASLTAAGAIRFSDALVRAEGPGNVVRGTGGVEMDDGSAVTGTLTVGPSLDLAGTAINTAAPAGLGLVVDGPLRLAATSVLQLVDGFPGPAPIEVRGAAQLAGQVVRQEIGDPDPTAVGDAIVVATWQSASGSFSGVSPASLPWGGVLGLQTSQSDARIVVMSPPKPIIYESAVLDVFDDVAVIAVDFEPGPTAAELWFELGRTTAYGEESEHLLVYPGQGGVYGAELGGLAPGTTYHARFRAKGLGGEVVGDDLTWTMPGTLPPAPATPTTPTTPTRPARPTRPTTPTTPVTPAAPQPLTPVAAPGPRTLALIRAGRNAFATTASYRLTRPCTTPCTATVDLLVRTGKQLFAAGDGKRLVRRKVTLKAGANSIRLTVPRAALRGLRWTRAGRFATLRVRLRVSLPQADGRTLITNRDGILRRPR